MHDFAFWILAQFPSLTLIVIIILSIHFVLYVIVYFKQSKLKVKIPKRKN